MNPASLCSNRATATSVLELRLELGKDFFSLLFSALCDASPDVCLLALDQEATLGNYTLKTSSNYQ
eukprot:1494652-Amphidinium_carterae.1